MILYGASGHSKVIIDILQKCDVDITTLVDDDLSLKEILGYPVTHVLENTGNEKVIISIGNNLIRYDLAHKLKDSIFGTAVHPSAVLATTSNIGVGSVVMANAVINSSVVVGSHCIINTGSILEHDTKIDNFVHISPGATLCGNVEVGIGSHIGAGAIVIPGLKIGNWCTIGAGAVVLRNVPDNAILYGNPGKVIKYNNTSNER